MPRKPKVVSPPDEVEIPDDVMAALTPTASERKIARLTK